MEQPWRRSVERWIFETNVGAAINRPDPSQQVVTGEHSPGVGREFLQLPILNRGKLDRPIGKAHPALNIVDGQVSQYVGMNPKTGTRPQVR